VNQLKFNSYNDGWNQDISLDSAVFQWDPK